ncbi:ATP-grasp domain-containing protein [Streptomyces coffeae]|uniref:ATP-grasp domain-containing protein n=1 Tax=Streptomyces coffeae TaxID=621382 RepID=A0ABS1NPB1_9ACTN|nr:ATP-grasp domain-containing protein [Streptomyces coffeae]MBL1101931.1 ATP-grasp domain-containing protein [Streptomyces coffeae]
MIRTPARSDGYLLAIGAHMALRERALVSAIRLFPGPIATIFAAPGARSAKFFDHIITGDPFAPRAALEAVQEFERESGLRPAAVVPFIDGGLWAGFAIAEHYGVPYLSREAIENSSINKDRMKDVLRAAGVRTPRYVKVADAAEVEAAVAELGLPCVIKPAAFGGSLGVRLVSSTAEAQEAFQYVMEIIDRNAATFSVVNRSVQVEEFCDLTEEVSVEVLNHGERREVLAVVDKALGPHPHFAEIGHRVPSVHVDDTALRDLAVRACEAIGLDRGLAHVEIRRQDGHEPVVIEVGARTAGGGILDQVERATGLSPYALHIASYLDLPDPGPTSPEARGVAAIAVLKAANGTITGIGAPTRVPEAVTGYEVSATVGAVSEPPANYLTREGYVECFWPGRKAQDVPPAEHLEIADDLAAQIFRVG